MNYKSLLTEGIMTEIWNTIDLGLENDELIFKLDEFIVKDFLDASYGKYLLQIHNNDTGKTQKYHLQDVLIDMDTLLSNSLHYKLKLKEESSNNIEERFFDISEIEPTTHAHSSISHPKYYIYCNCSREINYRFWFLEK